MEDTFIPVFLVSMTIGLILMAISRHYRLRIEKMDADFTGDITHDQEATDWYWYTRRINYQLMKATKYIGFLILTIPAGMLLGLIANFFDGKL